MHSTTAYSDGCRVDVCSLSLFLLAAFLQEKEDRRLERVKQAEEARIRKEAEQKRKDEARLKREEEKRKRDEEKLKRDEAKQLALK